MFCPVCNSEDLEDLVYHRGVYRCKSCLLLFRTSSVLPQWYEEVDYWYEGDEELKRYQESLFAWVKPYILDGNCIEIGAADGDFLACVQGHLRQNNAQTDECVYVELVNKIRPEYEFSEAFFGSFEQYRITHTRQHKKFSNIFLIDTIEHLSDIQLKFWQLRDLCKGRLFIITDDGDSLNAHNNILYMQDHNYIFTRTSISHLAHQHNFSVYKYFRSPHGYIVTILETR